MTDSSHPLYPIWSAMVARCHLVSHPWYAEYGGRGIVVCEEWRESFKRFVIDMEPRPSNYTLERKDNNLGYYKENCEWVTQAEQNRNQRRRKTALADEVVLDVFYSYLPEMLIARKHGIDKRTVYGIRKLKAGAYCTWLCRTYKLIDGIMTLK